MKVETEIQKSEELIQWLDKNIYGVEIKSNDRFRIAAGSLDMVLEHQKAIVLLTSHCLYGSAAALVRLIFESTADFIKLYAEIRKSRLRKIILMRRLLMR